MKKLLLLIILGVGTTAFSCTNYTTPINMTYDTSMIDWDLTLSNVFVLEWYDSDGANPDYRQSIYLPVKVTGFPKAHERDFKIYQTTGPRWRLKYGYPDESFEEFEDTVYKIDSYATKGDARIDFKFDYDRLHSSAMTVNSVSIPANEYHTTVSFIQDKGGELVGSANTVTVINRYAGLTRPTF